MTGSTRRDVGAAGLKVCRIGTGVGIGGGRDPGLRVSLLLISFFGVGGRMRRREGFVLNGALDGEVLGSSGRNRLGADAEVDLIP